MGYVRELPLDENDYPPFAQTKHAFGFIPNFLRSQSIRTDLIEAEIQLTGTILTTRARYRPAEGVVVGFAKFANYIAFGLGTLPDFDISKIPLAGGQAASSDLTG